MTDAEMVRAVAERIMGWKRYKPRASDDEHETWGYLPKDRSVIYASPREFANGNDWWPLTKDSDCFMVVDAMVAKGYAFTLAHVPSISSAPGFVAFRKGVTHAHSWEGAYVERDVPDRRRAILLAALKAARGEESRRG